MPGSVSTVGVAAALIVATVSLGVVGGAVVAAQRLAGAADAAALAAADTVSGATTGDPCERARQVAAAADAELRRCDVDGLVATITVGGAYGGVPFDARSRAGPPDVSSP